MFRSRLTRHRHKADLYNAQWNDDIHHVLHVAATHESSGYYAAYGSTELLGKAIAEGFAYQGANDAVSERAPRRPQRRIAAGRFRILHPKSRPDRQSRLWRTAERAGVARGDPGARQRLPARSADTRCCSWARNGARRRHSSFSATTRGSSPTPCGKGGARSSRAFLNSRIPSVSQRSLIPALNRLSSHPSSIGAGVDAEHLATYRDLLKIRRDFVQPLLPSIRHGGEALVVGEQAVRVIWRAGERRLVLDANLSSEAVAFPKSDAPSILALRRRRRLLRAVDRALGARSRMNAPRATYRLQLRASFGFSEAAAVAPYLAQLGVSHVYLSPIFKARPGSVHGYDVTDHNQLNPELGTEADYEAMIDAFRREGLGRILDIVPNHMGVWGADNPLWLDVLEWGPYSQYAGWFDIDWSAQDGKLLAPVLGAQYGEELRSGKLKLRFEDDGSFAIWAYDAHKLPIHPLTFPQILGHQNPALDRMADLFLDLPQWRPQVAERARALKSELASLAEQDGNIRAAIDARVELFNSDWRELDRLIREQFWRVAFHRVAEDEINYRRFFNINDLAGLRIEVGPVFDHVHARIFRMLESGEIDGLTNRSYRWAV